MSNLKNKGGRPSSAAFQPHELAKRSWADVASGRQPKINDFFASAQSTAPVKSAPVKSAPVKSAPVKSDRDLDSDEDAIMRD